MKNTRNVLKARLAAKAAAGPHPLSVPPVEGQRVNNRYLGDGTVLQPYDNGYAFVEFDSGAKCTVMNHSLFNPQ
jgi:hypothetical protein